MNITSIGRHLNVISVAIVVGSLFFAKLAPACTGIRLIAGDGTVVYARTLEFGTDLDSDVIMVPRGYARTGTTPQGENGLKWTSRYASLGANGVGLPYLVRWRQREGLGGWVVLFPHDRWLHEL